MAVAPLGRVDGHRSIRGRPRPRCRRRPLVVHRPGKTANRRLTDRLTPFALSSTPRSSSLTSASRRKQQRASPGAAGSAAPATLAHEWNRRARTRCSRVAHAAGLLPCGSATPTDRCRGRASAPPPGQGLVAPPNKILVACSSSAFGADVERRKDPGRGENNGQRQPDIEHDLGTLRTNVEDRDHTDHEAADRAARQVPGLQPLANWRFHGTILTPAATTRTAARGWLSAASIAKSNSLRPRAKSAAMRDTEHSFSRGSRSRVCLDAKRRPARRNAAGRSRTVVWSRGADVAGSVAQIWHRF